MARGYQQEEHTNNVYSPIARVQTLKLLLLYCCQYSLIIEQMDVETAFLNGNISGKVYISQPEGYEDSSNKVLKLNKSLYGLRESPRQWYECFNKYMTQINFERVNHDYCLYVCMYVKKESAFIF